jgi:hypothetical protein
MQPSDSQWHLRYEIFQVLLEKRGLATVTNWNAAWRRPEESIVVLAGNLENVSLKTWDDLRRFVSVGGSVLVATDQACQMHAFGKVRSGPIVSADVATRYQNYPDCLSIRDLDHANSLSNDLNQIVTNRSGWLEVPISILGTNRSSDWTWETIARLPSDCKPASSRRQPLIAVAQSSSDQGGIAVVSADASFFTNTMLWHGDNGQLAVNIVSLLNRNPRRQMIFAIDGVPQISYAESQRLSSMPPPRDTQPEVEPDMATMLRITNMAIRNVEESNVFNEVLKNRPRQFSIEQYFRWIWAGIAVAAVCFVVWIVARRRLSVPGFLGARKMRSMHSMLSTSQHPLNQNSMAANLLARDFCKRWTGVDSVEKWREYANDLKSNAKDSSPSFQAAADRSSLQSIFDIAISGKNSLLSDEQLVRLGTTINALLVQKSLV